MTIYSGDEDCGDEITSGCEPTCEHGFIGACAECDGSGQVPERDELVRETPDAYFYRMTVRGWRVVVSIPKD